MNTFIYIYRYISSLIELLTIVFSVNETVVFSLHYPNCESRSSHYIIRIVSHSGGTIRDK